MIIKHPYLHGALSTRINAMKKDQKTQSAIYRALPREFVKNNLDEFMHLIANQEELYSCANEQILGELDHLVDGEHKEKAGSNGEE